ncbi:hypothetical protein CYMTET_38842 [Cymbomonas tetramitiformis]|uniref:DUF1330 domain-containing protein n=1 Tax=Cymbomonas tetramitiformis TaxID=36881 RepID=A0AAE0CB86_9CHLO|nr:hypothetical protein CYMTET_38842 [Cymbomonas tetramitiformis]
MVSDMTKYVDPTRESVRALRDSDMQGPVEMLNLIKFHKEAKYDVAANNASKTGEEAYKLYKEELIRIAAGEIVWHAKVKGMFIGPMAEDYDYVMLVRYPSKEHFLKMMRNPDYKAALVHRYAGVEHTKLMVTQPMSRSKL